MPDLNLIDEGGFDESPAPSTLSHARRRKSGGGGSTGKVLILFLVIIIGGGGGYWLYKQGKLPFLKKKQPVVAQFQDEPFPENDLAAGDQNLNTQTTDSTNVPLLETTPLTSETSKPAGDQNAEGGGKTSPETTPMKKLDEMQGNFTIQVSAFREKKNADEIVSRLEDSGYPAFVEAIPMKGVNWYTVRIGHYASRSDAKKAVNDFALELRANYWIDRVRSK